MTRPPAPGRVDSDMRAVRRVRRNLWLLVGLAVLATGGLTRALESDPGPAAVAAVAVAGLAAAAAAALALRIWWYLLRP